MVGLLLPAKGFLIELPRPAGAVTARVAMFSSGELRLIALDDSGAVVASATSTDAAR